ncbi:hypothetical protein [Streptomyces sp. NPDC088915]|uniref:hypothetical protein n=1 Tax=Streptomyces sp. NPDC088915 TaxID=3365912 RepID=UPI003809342D
MPIALAKPTDDTPDTPPAPWYITVGTRPDGRVTSVELSDYPPSNDTTFRENVQATVWQTPLPEYEEDTARAVKVLDLELSTAYHTDDESEWARGEESARAFRFDRTDERAFLRAVEARLILAGVLDAHAGMVHCQGYGITLDTGEEHWAYRDGTGEWNFATRDILDMEGWSHRADAIAPATASPRRLAAAILLHLTDAGDVDTATLPPLLRARVAYGLWRLRPNWRNFKYRARFLLRLYRNRITARIR